MPKLKKTEAQKRLEQEKGLAVLLRSACIIEHGTLEAAADRMHMSMATLYRKLKTPGSVTLDQVRDMCTALPADMKENIRRLLLP